jgi:acyl-homoserine-lactone acylase
MKSYIVACLAVTALSCSAPPSPSPARPGSIPEATRWAQRAERVTIVRDDWGIPHITAPTDADAVFGLMFAQCEDDFVRVETNFIDALGRRAEAEGEAAIYQDLRMKLFIDPVELRALYDQAPPWLQALMVAWADGINYYLATHPQVKPRVLTRFEPWMALSFSEGSIGGDIERVSIEDLAAFYGGQPQAAARKLSRDAAAARAAARWAEPSGSNGFALAPSRTAGKRPLLLINPHTSFFFREEAQVTSGEGLNAYGALTWGQFFIYQGFNERLGWMHTSSGVDNVDEFLETVVRKGDQVFTARGAELRPVQVKSIAVPYRTATGTATKTFTTYRTEHGPVVRQVDGRWVAVALMERPLQALMQSYGRTKAKTLAEFKEVMALRANSSNNTVYADAAGNIGYFHANFVPRRDPSLDWTRPVDGSSPQAQ